MSLQKEVWDKLAPIDVSAQTRQKGKFSYLSWAWAWQILQEHYPESEISYSTPFFYPDGSCEIECTVTIKKGDSSFKRSIIHPVMNNKNMADKDVDARKINDTRMRGITKAIGLCGLGVYIFAGEDMPRDDIGDYITPEQAEIIHCLIEDTGSDEAKFLKFIKAESISKMFANSYDKYLAILEKKVKK